MVLWSFHYSSLLVSCAALKTITESFQVFHDLSLHHHHHLMSTVSKAPFALLTSSTIDDRLQLFPATTINLRSLSTQAAVLFITYLSTVIYYDRPRGNISCLSYDENLQDYLEAKPSQVESAGLGLYTTHSMKANTFLGSYPGVLRPVEKYRTGKLVAFPHSSEYIWRFTDNSLIIDPTDANGDLQELCVGGSMDLPGSQWIFSNELVRSLFSVPTLLARINEPPPGTDCNVYAIEDLSRRTVIFALSRDIVCGEEFFIDYGKTYDRSRYSQANPGNKGN